MHYLLLAIYSRTNAVKNLRLSFLALTEGCRISFLSNYLPLYSSSFHSLMKVIQERYGKPDWKGKGHAAGSVTLKFFQLGSLVFCTQLEKVVSHKLTATEGWKEISGGAGGGTKAKRGFTVDVFFSLIIDLSSLQLVYRILLLLKSLH